MPDTAPGKLPTVLLLAGELRDPWRRALEDAGLDVWSPGWLEGVTAARLERPDLVLVSMDLPPNAPDRAEEQDDTCDEERRVHHGRHVAPTRREMRDPIPQRSDADSSASSSDTPDGGPSPSANGVPA